ncbi:energy transducer TonB [Luteimonas panaciterrae]|uniref:energy transducer TonB n=1 Tax=Luteimonas panaciterrae TaxID=363885 RepID=UPI001CFA1F1E|nr:energy transducer TonB [Luteimonas panaciterrae]
MTRNRWWGLCLLFMAFMAVAGVSRKEVLQQMELSLLVTGSVDIEPDGHVSAYVVDQPEKLPGGVRELIAKNVPKWRFEPILVDGKAVSARAKMSLHVVAKRVDDDRFDATIDAANFGTGEQVPGVDLTVKEMKPPKYPKWAVMNGFKGTVYLVLRVDRQGAVEDVVVEQVNLRTAGTPKQMELGRNHLSRAALDAAKAWTFVPPTKGENAKQESWSIRVPVDYSLEGEDRTQKYGRWQAYIPGPRQGIPWDTGEDGNASSPDALADGDIYMIGAGPRLLTPLGQG